jgi:4-hydroxy-3-methylbut-2-enyl diphosphate reductase
VDDIPLGAPTVFSAHGVSHAVVAQAATRGLQVIDATCPLVTKVHQQAQRYAQQGRAVLVIGHAGHQEVVGTLGRVSGARLVSTVADVHQLQVPPDTALAYVTQTTLSLDDTRDIIAALHVRFSNLQGPETDDICYATQNRQAAVRELADQVDVVLIVGASNSSNSARLREVAEQAGVPAYLVADESGVDPAWLLGARRIGISAGASTPEVLVQRVLRRLGEGGAGRVVQVPGREERINFRLPLALIERAA